MFQKNLDRSTEPPAKRRKIPKILDGRFYTIVSNVDGNIEAKCEECGEIRKGNLGSTGNFKSHYKKHKQRAEEVEKYLKQTVEFPDDTENQRKRQLEIRDMLPAISDAKVFSISKRYKL